MRTHNEWRAAPLFVLMRHLTVAVGMHMLMKMNLFIEQDATILHEVGFIGGRGEEPRIVGNENIA